MIKGRSPYPFETIAVAVSFTPGLSFLIGEMQRLCELHNARAIFIHIGKKTGEKQRELSALLSENGFHDGNSKIYWEHGEVVNGILNICKNEVVDLLMIGASGKEDFQIPTGGITFSIATKAKCSVLIIAGHPSGGFKKIVVNGTEHKKTNLTVLTAIYMADKEKSDGLFVAETNRGLSLADSEKGYSHQGTMTNSHVFRHAIEETNVNVNFFSLSNEQCQTVSEYAFKSNSDLVVTHSSDHHLLIFDRILNDDGIEALLQKLPCSLLIVHSRLPE